MQLRSKQKRQAQKAMTKHGTLNIGAMVMLPAAAALAAAIATANGVWQAYMATYVTVIILNSIITVPAAFLSWLFLRRSTGETARLIAIMPTLVPSLWGSIWYIWYAFFPAEVAAGAEYLGAPQYLFVAMLATTFLVLLARITRLAPRAS
jgi:hypothetical protein